MNSFTSGPVELRDGRKVDLRPIRQDDAPRLVDLHRRLSFDTQYLRFFGPKPELLPEEAVYLAGVDFRSRFAVVGAVVEDGEERLVAVGRFDVTGDDVAEAAIVVRDDYQRQGLGTAVLRGIVSIGRQLGLRAFTGEVLPENRQMLALLERYGLNAGSPESVVNVRAVIEPDGVRIES